MPQTRYDPFMGSLPPPAQDPQQMQQGQPVRQPGNPMDDILAQMIQKNLGATPPPDRPLSQWEIFAGLSNPALMEMVLARKQDTPEARQYAQGQKMLPTMIQAQGQRQAAQATQGRFNQTQNRLVGQADIRNQLSRWQSGSVNTIDESGVNVTMPIWKDKLTGQITDADRNPIDASQFTSPIHWQVAYDEGGNAMQVPTSPLPQGGSPSQNPLPSHQGAPGGPNIGGGGPANLAPKPPAGGPTRGLGFRKTPPANLLGMHQQLDNAELMLNEMKGNWEQRPTSMGRQALGTASANLLSRGMGANLGLSGVAGAIDKHAVIHERDREAIATTLSFPLSGSRRGMEGARQSLLGIIPHYTDPPEVWNAFDTQMRMLIQNSRRMPWGTAPDEAAKQYEPMFDQFLASASSSSAIAGQGGPFAGKKMRNSTFMNLPPSEQQRFIQGGGQVSD